MNSLLALCLLGLVYTVQGEDPPSIDYFELRPLPIGGCDDGWYHYQGNCYYRNSGEKMDYLAAEVYCSEFGAHLASIHSQEENEFVVTELGQGWLGMMAEAADDWENELPSFGWTDGSDFTDFEAWARNSPRFPTKKGIDSGAIMKDGGIWKDQKLTYNGNNAFPICKKPVGEMVIERPEPIEPQRGCWYPMETVQGAQHAYGGIPRKDLETLEACKRACEDNVEGCIGIDWNHSAAPFLDTRCWTHMEQHDGMNENPDADHYAKGEFMICE